MFADNLKLMTTFACGLMKPLAGLTSMILSFVALILKVTKEKL